MTSPALPVTTERPSVVAVCDVCPHPVASHDAIGLRFCSATFDGAMTRGCVCPSS